MLQWLFVSAGSALLENVVFGRSPGMDLDLHDHRTQPGYCPHRLAQRAVTTRSSGARLNVAAGTRYR
ncbi:MAG: hypothetical protein JWP08_3507 [Bryobacterales bacterium]|nr:hypothetical protein [Bryobacterales bacterium]